MNSLALDLFCGLGGWSDGLAAEGFDVLGVELNQEIAELYKHPIIIDDVCNLNPREFRGYDLIVGSPPCHNFTVGSDAWWKVKKDPAEGVRLAKAMLDFVEVAKPKYWLMENVRGLKKYIDIKPRGIYKLSRTMFRPFWGNFPAFFIPIDYDKPLMKEVDNYPKSMPRQWIKAKIPFCVSSSLGRAVKNAISEQTK